MAAERPNVLFIMTDQQRYDTLGLYGNSVIRTPHLDEMAAHSAVFDHFYVTNPVCVPSRASFLTGRYPTAHRARDLNYALGTDELHLPGILKQAGYTVALSGKSHVLASRELNKFDELFEVRHRKARVASAAGPYGGGVDPTELESYSTNLVCDHALAFLESRRTTDAPFFHWVSFPDPHTPYQVPEPFASMYSPDDVPAPNTFPGELEGKPLPQRLIHELQEMDNASEGVIRRMIAIYYGMITLLDEAVGRILAKLRELDMERDTIVVFTSDHGDYMGDHGLARKSWNFYDCLLRVPCLIRWPGEVVPRRASETMAENVDLLPTILDLVGVPVPGGVQGQSMVPFLKGESERIKESVFASAGNPGEIVEVSSVEEWRGMGDRPGPLWSIGAVQGCMIRTMDWKLCFYVNGDGELYDLREDPGELDNLYGKEQFADTEREMMRELMVARMRYEDPRPPSLDRMHPA